MKLVRTAILTTLTALLLSLSLSTPSWAQWGYPPQQPTASERDVQELQHQGMLNEERVNSLKALVETQNSRISDLQTFVGWVIGVLGLVLPIAMVVVSGATYVRAKTEAGETASKAADKWMDEHAPEKVGELETHYREQIEKRLAAAEQEIKSLLKDAKGYVYTISQTLKSVQDSVTKGEEPNVSDVEIDVLNKAEKTAEAIPESERTYLDWEVLGITASLDGDYNKMAKAFESAALAADASQEQIIQALFGGAWALEQSGCDEDAIAAYDAIAQRFVRHEDLWARRMVASALVNKGVVLGKGGNAAEALATFNEVEKLYGEFNDPALREQIAKARGSRGFARLVLAKEAERKLENAGSIGSLLAVALEDTEASLLDLPDSHIILGNKGYALFLLGQVDKVEAPLRRALELGGEKALKNALEDAKTYPLPQDEAFVVLVNRLWAEVQATETDV